MSEYEVVKGCHIDINNIVNNEKYSAFTKCFALGKTSANIRALYKFGEMRKSSYNKLQSHIKRAMHKVYIDFIERGFY